MGQLERLRELVADGSVWRMSALAAQGVTATTVSRALAANVIERLSRGTYQMVGASPSTHGDLAAVAARLRDGVVCLSSAASFHGLSDRVPSQIWVAIPNNRRPPVMDWPSIRTVRWRASVALRVGVMDHRICGVTVRITDRERTVVDMLRMSSKVGEDRAIEALRDFIQDGGSIPALSRMADKFNASSLLSPYLKALSTIGVSYARQGTSHLQQT